MLSGYVLLFSVHRGYLTEDPRCVVASDLVTEHDFELKDMIIELGLYDDIFVCPANAGDGTSDSLSSTQDINRKIVKALANETELQRKASAALAWTRQHLSGLRELDLIIDLSERSALFSAPLTMDANDGKEPQIPLRSARLRPPIFLHLQVSAIPPIR